MTHPMKCIAVLQHILGYAIGSLEEWFILRRINGASYETIMRYIYGTSTKYIVTGEHLSKAFLIGHRMIVEMTLRVYEQDPEKPQVEKSRDGTIFVTLKGQLVQRFVYDGHPAIDRIFLSRPDFFGDPRIRSRALYASIVDRQYERVKMLMAAGASLDEIYGINDYTRDAMIVSICSSPYDKLALDLFIALLQNIPMNAMTGSRFGMILSNATVEYIPIILPYMYLALRDVGEMYLTNLAIVCYSKSVHKIDIPTILRKYIMAANYGERTM